MSPELDAQRALEACVLTIHCLFPFKDSLPARRCETGEDYVALCSGGIKPEGEPHPATFADPRRAVMAFMAAFAVYAEGKEGRLLWRARPRLEEADPVAGGGWAVYSRLIITDKPIDQALVAEFSQAA